MSDSHDRPLVQSAQITESRLEMAIWTSDPTKLVANMDESGLILTFQVVNGANILTVPVAFNVGVDAGAQWTIIASRLRPTPTSNQLLVHPQLLRFNAAGKISLGKRKSSLIFDVAKYHGLLKENDPGANNLADAWGAGRLELDVEVNQGPPARIHTLNVNLLNS